MSSFVGHTLTGGFIYSLKADTSKYRYLWLIWLLVVSILPDLDYFIPSLQKPQHGGIRITYSLSFGILFPILIIIALFLLQCRGKEIKVRSIQVLLAGISHIFLDFLVGVHPMPLFWPFHDSTFRLNYGILPSAGALDLTNFYLYRNLMFELGILVPIFVSVLLFKRGREDFRCKPWLAPILVLVTILMVLASINLSR